MRQYLYDYRQYGTTKEKASKYRLRTKNAGRLEKVLEEGTAAVVDSRAAEDSWEGEKSLNGERGRFFNLWRVVAQSRHITAVVL